MTLYTAIASTTAITTATTTRKRPGSARSVNQPHSWNAYSDTTFAFQNNGQPVKRVHGYYPVRNNGQTSKVVPNRRPFSGPPNAGMRLMPPTTDSRVSDDCLVSGSPVFSYNVPRIKRGLLL
ncbi:6784_t:CDS:2 [Paraglomus brasilianum]|uniref:6784_t:CDS:1 n=1 Tax=Paraglomus brasilianum TaxID=144538 RepID=A0A9N8YVP3_9GLOM|nr:6784_t:CDS:2 [Paraglomus brasilianum]